MQTLKDIINYKKNEVDHEKKHMPSIQIDNLISSKDTKFKPRGFLNALVSNKNNFGIISELKKASPSKGLIREDFNPLLIAEQYKKSGATCLSVLTDKNFFQGKNSYIFDIKKQVDLPVLRKDFIIDPWQIKQSFLLEADCILLILSCLSLTQAKEFEIEAMELGMDVLIETHTESEIEQANQLKSKMIGINNRNLHDMKVDLNTSINLIKYLDKSKIAISESGISCKSDIENLNTYGFRNFLIGEAFMKEKNINKIFNKIIFNN